MRHVSVLLVLSLAACSIVGGGKLGAGGGGHGGGLAAPVPGAGDEYEAVQALPRNLKSVEHSYEMMLEYLDKMEKQLADGTLTNPEDIHSVRITWLTWFGNMIRGGIPACPACKNHAKYKEMKAGAVAINDRFAALEKAVASCTYGYRMSNGDLLPMTLDWSEQEWKDIQDKAMPPSYRQKERCWLDDKNGKAGKPSGWAY